MGISDAFVAFCSLSGSQVILRGGLERKSGLTSPYLHLLPCVWWQVPLEDLQASSLSGAWETWVPVARADPQETLCFTLLVGHPV